MISLVVLCKNEVDNILPFLLHHGKFFPEIIIVDDYSEDDSLLMVESYKLRPGSSKVSVFQRKLLPSFSEQRNFAAAQISYGYYMRLDPDERIPVYFLAQLPEMYKALTDQKVDLVVMPRLNFINGIEAGPYPDMQIRIVRAGLSWVNNIHETIEGAQFMNVIQAQCDVIHWKTAYMQERRNKFYYDNFEEQRVLVDKQKVFRGAGLT